MRGTGWRHRQKPLKECTSAVPEVVVGGRVVLAEPLQDEFVVQQAVEGPEEEDVEGQVADPLLLKVSTKSVQLPAGPEEHKLHNSSIFSVEAT